MASNNVVASHTYATALEPDLAVYTVSDQPEVLAGRNPSMLIRPEAQLPMSWILPCESCHPQGLAEAAADFPRARLAHEVAQRSVNQQRQISSACMSAQLPCSKLVRQICWLALQHGNNFDWRWLL